MVASKPKPSASTTRGHAQTNPRERGRRRVFEGTYKWYFGCTKSQSRIQFSRCLNHVTIHLPAYWFNHCDGVHVSKMAVLNGHGRDGRAGGEISAFFSFSVKSRIQVFLSVRAYKCCDKSSTQYFLSITGVDLHHSQLVGIRGIGSSLNSSLRTIRCL